MTVQPAPGAGTSSGQIVSGGSTPSVSASEGNLVAPIAAAEPTSNVLKYHDQISKFSDCPPKQIGEHSHGFRVCFSDPNDPRNFLPNAILDLNRLDGRAPPPCCSAYAVSLYSDLEFLSSRVKAILRTNKKFLQKKGDHYIKIALDANCGRATTADTHGHFDLFEYAHFNPISAMTEMGGLAL